MTLNCYSTAEKFEERVASVGLIGTAKQTSNLSPKRCNGERLREASNLWY